MKGKISKIKSMEDELVLPVTTVEAVYMEDGITKLSDEIKDVLKYEEFDNESVTAEIPDVIEEIDGIKKNISEINSSLDNIENEKATRQEVDVKIAENKSLTDSEISKLKEITNTWETFKASGGEISGNLLAIQLATKSISNNYRWAEETHGTGYKIISSNTNPSTGDWREEFIMAYDGFAPKNDKVLGTTENSWNDIFIKGVSKNTNGYTKLPNGLIMQWLYVGGSLSQGKGVIEGNLPMTFPNDYLGIFANVTYVDDESTYNNLFNCNAKFVNKGYYNVNIKNLESNTGSFANCYVLAIGY